MSISLTDRNSTPITNPTPTPTPFDITIIDRNIPSNTHNIYDITFDSNLTIETLLTSSPSLVDAWFLETHRLHNPFPLLIGLDIEWRPNFQRGRKNRTAVLQLCINNRCLVFQIIHSPFIPTSLATFLSNINNKFVGVGIQDDIEKLLNDYKIHVANFDDLRTLAANVLNDREMLKTGIKTLSQRVLGKTVQKPKKVSMSKWDNKKLNEDQVKYATVDAFVSFEVGRRLYSNKFF